MSFLEYLRSRQDYYRNKISSSNTLSILAQIDNKEFYYLNFFKITHFIFLFIDYLKLNNI